MQEQFTLPFHIHLINIPTYINFVKNYKLFAWNCSNSVWIFCSILDLEFHTLGSVCGLIGGHSNWSIELRLNMHTIKWECRAVAAIKWMFGHRHITTTTTQNLNSERASVCLPYSFFYTHYTRFNQKLNVSYIYSCIKMSVWDSKRRNEYFNTLRSHNIHRSIYFSYSFGLFFVYEYMYIYITWSSVWVCACVNNRIFVSIPQLQKWKSSTSSIVPLLSQYFALGFWPVQ